MPMTPSTQDAAVFSEIVSRDGWSIPEVGDCLKHFAAQTQASEETVCRSLLAWLDAVPHVGEHATGRRFTRLQFVENSLNAAGFALTLRDFASWLAAADGDWRPNDMLPYAPQDLTLTLREARIEQLEHELHHMEVTANRARAEVNFVAAERDHFYQQVYHQVCQQVCQQVSQQVSANYESSASWRVTAPLRRAMNFSRRMQASIRGLLSRAPASGPTGAPADVIGAVNEAATVRLATTSAPWNQPGYSTEAAWRVQGAADFDRHDYSEWVRRYDTLSSDDHAALVRRAEALDKKPVISVLMSAEHPNPECLVQAVESVLAQIYPHWELCIAVAVDSSPVIKPILQRFASQDARIKLIFGDAVEPLKPTSARQAALSLATGEWIVLLDAIDLIAVRALFMLAEGVNKHPEVRLMYSDEDKLAGPWGDEGERCLPDFKPDWNLDLFYAQDFTEHLCAIDTALVRQVGGFDARFNSAASFDLSLRCIEQLDARQIYHIPFILYHKRLAETMDASSLLEGTHALMQGEAALNAHFERRGMAATAHTAELGYRISYALPAQPPLVSLIIPTKNNTQLLRQCIESILYKTSYPHYEMLIVDNGSDLPETLDYLKSLASEPRIRVIRDSYAFNYSALNNAAVKLAKGEVIGLINDDIEVKTGDWLSEMVSHALRPDVGAVGARLWYPDHTLQHAGMVLVGGVARHAHKHLPQGAPGFCGRAVLTQEFTAVTGACLVVKKALYEQVGVLNERELAIGFNDVDFCLRLQEAGYSNVWTPYAELYHHESATRGQDDSPEKQRRAEKELRYMRKRWGNKLHIDPAYNPNLTDGHGDFSLAWPPRVDPSDP